ncbi:hypothetical protein HK405_011556, partial [Cladochytrium tenue]
SRPAAAARRLGSTHQRRPSSRRAGRQGAAAAAADAAHGGLGDVLLNDDGLEDILYEDSDDSDVDGGWRQPDEESPFEAVRVDRRLIPDLERGLKHAVRRGMQFRNFLNLAPNAAAAASTSLVPDIALRKDDAGNVGIDAWEFAGQRAGGEGARTGDQVANAASATTGAVGGDGLVLPHYVKSGASTNNDTGVTSTAQTSTTSVLTDLVYQGLAGMGLFTASASTTSSSSDSGILPRQSLADADTAATPALTSPSPLLSTILPPPEPSPLAASVAAVAGSRENHASEADLERLLLDGSDAAAALGAARARAAAAAAAAAAQDNGMVAAASASASNGLAGASLSGSATSLTPSTTLARHRYRRRGHTDGGDGALSAADLATRLEQSLPRVSAEADASVFASAATANAARRKSTETLSVTQGNPFLRPPPLPIDAPAPTNATSRPTTASNPRDTRKPSGTAYSTVPAPAPAPATPTPLFGGPLLKASTISPIQVHTSIGASKASRQPPSNVVATTTAPTLTPAALASPLQIKTDDASAAKDPSPTPSADPAGPRRTQTPTSKKKFPWGPHATASQMPPAQPGSSSASATASVTDNFSGPNHHLASDALPRAAQAPLRDDDASAGPACPRLLKQRQRSRGGLKYHQRLADDAEDDGNTAEPAMEPRRSSGDRPSAHSLLLPPLGGLDALEPDDVSAQPAATARRSRAGSVAQLWLASAAGSHSHAAIQNRRSASDATRLPDHVLVDGASAGLPGHVIAATAAASTALRPLDAPLAAATADARATPASGSTRRSGGGAPDSDVDSAAAGLSDDNDGGSGEADTDSDEMEAGRRARTRRGANAPTAAVGGRRFTLVRGAFDALRGFVRGGGGTGSVNPGSGA